MDEAGARDITQWRYDEPYTMYSLQDQTAVDEVVSYLTDPENRIYRIDNAEHALLAFCSFGDDAQVGGGDYDEEAFDVGLGLRPSLTGKGLGPAMIAEVLQFALDHFEVRLFRATIAGFNERAQKAWQKNGFVITQDFARTFDKKPFVILTRPARTPKN
jgi:RimJ/RimL family protein N-acetyltransferase